jgi:hypothetical protein
MTSLTTQASLREATENTQPQAATVGTRIIISALDTAIGTRHGHYCRGTTREFLHLEDRATFGIHAFLIRSPLFMLSPLSGLSGNRASGSRRSGCGLAQGGREVTVYISTLEAGMSNIKE